MFEILDAAKYVWMLDMFAKTSTFVLIVSKRAFYDFFMMELLSDFSKCLSFGVKLGVLKSARVYDLWMCRGCCTSVVAVAQHC